MPLTLTPTQKTQTRFAALTKIINRCTAAIEREQRLTAQIMKEEHARYLHRQSQAAYVAKQKAEVAS